MMIASVVIALTLAVLLCVFGVAFIIVGTLTTATTGYGRSLKESGRVFLWAGLGMQAFLILVMVSDIFGPI